MCKASVGDLIGRRNLPVGGGLSGNERIRGASRLSASVVSAAHWPERRSARCFYFWRGIVRDDIKGPTLLRQYNMQPDKECSFFTKFRTIFLKRGDGRIMGQLRKFLSLGARARFSMRLVCACVCE